MYRVSIFVCVIFIIQSCSTTRPFYNKVEKDWQTASPPGDEFLKHSIYLIGDAGNPQTDPLEPSLTQLKDLLDQKQEKSTVVFLGDNIYPQGLPPLDKPEREEAENRLKPQLDILKNYDGRIVFIPGNHDWREGKKKGNKYVKRQEKFVEKYLNRGNVFLPDKACPGPVEIEIADDITLIIIDTQWWLHQHKKPKKGDCGIKNEIEFALEFEAILLKNKDKKIIVAGHHPVFSNGPHGGHFPVKDHIFPLTATNDNFYLPLPVIGSLYPLYRSWLGNIQDMSHPVYSALRKSLIHAFKPYNNLIYAAGHEHSLQYIPQDNQHFVVSGAGSKTSFTSKYGDAAFAYSENGIAAINYYENGEIWLEFLATKTGTSNSELVFRKKLKEKDKVVPKLQASSISEVDYSDSTIVAVPGKRYKAGPIKRFLLGSLYRDAWTTPVEVPVLDLRNEKGGLTPIKKGGGMQTLSLRLQGGDGKQYVLRSVEKFPVKAIPSFLRKTFAVDLVQDHMAAALPYAAGVVPNIADAVGVYHSNPKMVYIPNDEVLGDYRDEFGGILAIFEERPAGEQSDKAFFGNSKKLVSTPKMIDKLHSDAKHQVDQRMLARARLLDILLGDWDRHEDQWRWATYKSENGTLYRPIPRDRDQVFYKIVGVFPSIINRKWAIRKFQNFNYKIRDLEGLTFNAKYVDRSFLTQMELRDWLAIADSMKQQLTDEVIENSIHQLPDTIFSFYGEEIISKLKSRRNNWTEIARKHYSSLAKQVDVVGTDKKELFVIKRLNDNETNVRVWHINKKGEKKFKFYERTFKREETKEISLYGLGDDDRFELSGEVNKGILIRVIGGTGKDHILDNSKVKGLGKKTRVYDSKKKNTLELGSEAKYLTARDDFMNEYDRKAFQYDHLMPKLFYGYNADDGVFLGGGFTYTKHGFKKSPYKYTQTFMANIATGTGAFNIKYGAKYNTLIGKWDLLTNLDVQAPNFTSNFYGLGNEYPVGINLDNSSFYRLRTNLVDFDLAMKRKVGNSHAISFGPYFQYVKPEMTENRFVSELNLSGLDASHFQARYFTGGKLKYQVKDMDNNAYPTRGYNIITEGSFNVDVTDTDVLFGQVKGEMSLYFTFHIPLQTTVAIRAGVATNFGEWKFYQANSLGQNENLRGYRRNRFSGETAFFHNTELRIKLFQVNTYLFPAKVGIFGLFDQGRVWLDNENSEKWYRSYGGGIWISPLNVTVIKANYVYSDEERLFQFGLGFLF